MKKLDISNVLRSIVEVDSLGLLIEFLLVILSLAIIFNLFTGDRARLFSQMDAQLGRRAQSAPFPADNPTVRKLLIEEFGLTADDVDEISHVKVECQSIREHFCVKGSIWSERKDSDRHKLGDIDRVRSWARTQPKFPLWVAFFLALASFSLRAIKWKQNSRKDGQKEA